MIKTFAHKGLEKFFYTSSKAGIQAKHAPKLRIILGFLDTAHEVADVDFPGARLHPLKGDRKNQWAVNVQGGWRITFRFESGDAYGVHYENYH